jgi:cytochrome P450
MSEVPNDGIIRFPVLFNVDMLLLTGPSSLAEVLVHKSYDYHKPAPVRKFLSIILGEGLVVVEDDVHKFQRKHATPAFSFRHIKELYPIFWSKAVEMSRGIAAEVYENPEPSFSEKKSENPQGIVEINHWSNKATMDIIGVAGLGRDFNALKNPDDELLKNYEEILEPTTEKGIYFALNIVLPHRLIAMLPWRLNERLKVTTGMLRKFCLQLIRDKKQAIKAQGEDNIDILSLLIKSNDFADENLVDQLLTFLAAG